MEWADQVLRQGAAACTPWVGVCGEGRVEFGEEIGEVFFDGDGGKDEAVGDGGVAAPTIRPEYGGARTVSVLSGPPLLR